MTTRDELLQDLEPLKGRQCALGTLESTEITGQLEVTAKLYGTNARLTVVCGSCGQLCERIVSPSGEANTKYQPRVCNAR